MGAKRPFCVFCGKKWGLGISRGEHKDFFWVGCVHSHFMKSECGVAWGKPQFMKSGLVDAGFLTTDYTDG